MFHIEKIPLESPAPVRCASGTASDRRRRRDQSVQRRRPNVSSAVRGDWFDLPQVKKLTRQFDHGEGSNPILPGATGSHHPPSVGLRLTVVVKLEPLLLEPRQCDPILTGRLDPTQLLKMSILIQVLQDDKLQPLIKDNEILKNKIEILEKIIEYFEKEKKKNDILIFGLDEKENSSVELFEKVQDYRFEELEEALTSIKWDVIDLCEVRKLGEEIEYSEYIFYFYGKTQGRKHRKEERLSVLREQIEKIGGINKGLKQLIEYTQWIPNMKTKSKNKNEKLTAKRLSIVKVSTDSYEKLYTDRTLPAEEEKEIYEEEIPCILKSEVIKAIQSQKSGKAPGDDKISNEILKQSSIEICRFQGEEFGIEKGVRQGDPLSPKLSIAVLEDIFRNLDWEHFGININGSNLNHLRFADDIVLFAEKPGTLQTMLQQLDGESRKAGLSMNLTKTKRMMNDLKENIVAAISEEFNQSGTVVAWRRLGFGSEGIRFDPGHDPIDQ
ncbi:Retrovirus-related Pol polyprotein from type-1 retrotransposable element R2 [Eumeta japonica]|uniref:Retrovirus-related Pol polyprotein from type-1 retrotransposable element R2 n=1 Tax=Eumeta variegata TaxID=151549 RepID=A0A4C1T398_EUMVA|nr:Retrovirus-related Pol polyprotein from type-1 retrotransposable element R2 [Eumeta japonica]